jgi:catechol 2,3-dioxygenase-like lactoylglutathione lyase family enzyme
MGDDPAVHSELIAVAVDCLDAERCAAFWCAALGVEVRGRWGDAHEVQYVEIGSADRPMLVFQPVPEGKVGKNRLHLDIAPASGSQEDEVERLVRLGAVRVADEAEHPWVVLADPEGNEFCVLPPRSG